MESVLILLTTDTQIVIKKLVLKKRFFRQHLLDVILFYSIRLGEVKYIDIKNRAYYFFDDMINIEVFDSNLLKIDKRSQKNIGIYNIGYITIKKIDDYESNYSVTPLYLRDNHANGYIEEKNGNKYLIFDSADKNKETLKKRCRCLEWN